MTKSYENQQQQSSNNNKLFQRIRDKPGLVGNLNSYYYTAVRYKISYASKNCKASDQLI